jgi:flagellar motor switch protein FliN/FliY
MNGPDTPNAQDLAFEELAPRAGAPASSLDMNDLTKVKLTVSAEVGKRRMSVREVIDLKRGSVVQLDKLAGEMTDILINGVPLAKGEVVVIGDNLHVRIGEIAGATSEKLEGAAEQ